MAFPPAITPHSRRKPGPTLQPSHPRLNGSRLAPGRRPKGGSMRAFPAGVRDIDDDAVGAGPFLLEIDMNLIAHGGVAALLRGQPLAVRALQLGAKIGRAS